MRGYIITAVDESDIRRKTESICYDLLGLPKFRDVYSKTRGVLLFRVKSALEKSVVVHESELDPKARGVIDALVQENIVVKIGEIYIYKPSMKRLVDELTKIIESAVRVTIIDVAKATGLPESVIRWLIDDKYYVFGIDIYKRHEKESVLQIVARYLEDVGIIPVNDVSELLLDEIVKRDWAVRIGDLIVYRLYLKQIEETLGTVGHDRKLEEVARLIDIKSEYLRRIVGRLGYVVIDDKLYAIRSYIISLLSEKSRTKTRWGTTISLGLLYQGMGDEKALRIIQYLLASKNWRTRLSAIIALGLLFQKTGSQKARNLLAKAVGDDKYEIGISLIVWGLITQHQMIYDINYISNYIDKSDPTIKGFAAIALGLMTHGTGELFAFEFLKNLLLEGNEEVVIKATIGLGLAFQGLGKRRFLWNPGAKALKSLKPLLANENYRVRWHAALAMGQICRGLANARVAEMIFPLLDDTEYRVRWAAISLGLIYEGTANIDIFDKLRALQDYLDSRVWSGLALATGLIFKGHRSSEAENFLFKLIKSSETDVLTYTAIGLGLLYHRTENKRISGILKELLNHNDPMVRWGAAIGIALVHHATGNSRALAMLREKFIDQDREVRWAATLGLGVIYKREPTNIPLYILAQGSKYNSIDWTSILI